MTRTHRLSPALVAGLVLALIAGLAGCKQQKSKLDEVVKGVRLGKSTTAPTTGVTTTPPPNGAGSGAQGAPAEAIDSKAILARKATSPSVQVKHVLIGWKELEGVYRGQMDPRAKARTNADAAKLAQEIAAKLEALPAGDGAAIDAIVKEHSEDPGSAQSGEPYDVTPDTQFVPEFKNLALRLMVNEVGIVKTSYGYHVIIRIPPPPPDPVESADILERTTSETTTVRVQHVLIGWKGAPAARAATRSKEEADKLAQEVLGKVRANGDMAALMKQYSEDPGSKDNARVYDVAPDSPMVEPFKKLSLRLAIGEAGIVKSPFGFHVIKRLPPPPPDTLESAAILGRQPTTQKAKVKHILLGWNELSAGDERAKKRDRATLETLVKATMAKLKGGAKIEPLMAELSEDPGSAKSGEGYDVTPDAGLVEPFKNLSLRLNVGEVGAVKTNYGIHIIQRTE